MKIVDLLKRESVELNGKVTSKPETIEKMVALMAAGGNLADVEAYKKGVFAREEESTTGIGEGIAIPHGKCDAVTKPGLAAMVVKDGVDYDSLDGEPAKLIFLIAAPDTEDNVHLEVLSRLSMLLMDPDFRTGLMEAENVDAFFKCIDEAERKRFPEEYETEEKSSENTSDETQVMHTVPDIGCWQLPHVRLESHILTWRQKVWKIKRKKWASRLKLRPMVPVVRKMC